MCYHFAEKRKTRNRLLSMNPQHLQLESNRMMKNTRRASTAHAFCQCAATRIQSHWKEYRSRRLLDHYHMFYIVIGLQGFNPNICEFITKTFSNVGDWAQELDKTSKDLWNLQNQTNQQLITEHLIEHHLIMNSIWNFWAFHINGSEM